MDFTLEVERSLRVMDGSVTILDASAGVQAQTITVWNQASRFNLPSVFFVNKMDKPTANLKYSIDSVENRLSHPVVPIVIPIFDDNNHFVGLIDLMTKTFLDFKNANSTWIEFDSQNFKYADDYNFGFESMISKICEVNEDFEKLAMSSSLEQISSNVIKQGNFLDRFKFRLFFFSTSNFHFGSKNFSVGVWLCI